MKLESRYFMAGAIFYAIAALVYWFMSREPAGTTALALSTGLAGLVSFYLFLTGRRIDPRPEDQLEADVAEGAGELGFFSPHSWWPIAVAAGGAMISLGVVIGYWMLFIGIIATGLAVIGLVFEYYRGEFSH